jgi:tRNA/tmRNA/rRNA uracil-C5-methylase (TrmA/RlmC/RlmD family)
MSAISAEQIAELRRLLAKATPAPWDVQREVGGASAAIDERQTEILVAPTARTQDLRLVVALRNIADDLLTELETLRSK